MSTKTTPVSSKKKIGTPEGKRKTRKKIVKNLHAGNINFNTYISKVLHQVQPEIRITVNAKSQINAIINYLGEDIARYAKDLSLSSDRKTVNSRDIQAAVRILLTAELTKHSVSEGTKAVVKFESNKGKEDKERKTASSRAGLQFPPSRTKLFIKKYSKRQSAGAAIFLAAVLEYLSAEILELSGNVARDNKKGTISTKHVLLAISKDPEIKFLLYKSHIKLQGGEFVHVLIEHKKSKKVKKVKNPEKVQKVKK